ncbi:MAG: NUDIX hydrolase [Candidatus Eremiobacteraeota bacterium]|nr:NUDIX hydrolase [Candidatus Eremiobacteraeota bacterium]MBC5826568.1 NUDIX hydrolase [Candidatus Eremiobacteraeota bacterium]
MKVRGTRRIYEGRVVNLRVDDMEFQAGKHGDIEIVEHGGGVAIIAQPAADSIILVRQFRPSTGRRLWEIPAGKLERGEEPAACAGRELQEETGYRAAVLQKLWSFYTAPGFCSELLHLFQAQGLSRGEPSPDEHEDITVEIFKVAEAWALVERDELPDAKSQIALAWLRGNAAVAAGAIGRP